jgi:hypothetical protein
MLSEDISPTVDLEARLTAAIREACDRYFLIQHEHLQSQYRDFLMTARSCGRSLKWELMVVPPETCFSLHAHPNMECIFVAKGTFYEYRREVYYIIRDTLSQD